MSATVCIFAKAPDAGGVKTRLASSIGTARAVQLARAFLEDTLALATQLASVRVVVSLAGTEPTLGRGSVEIWQQGEGNLGSRLEHGLQRALLASEKVLAIGTDSPGLPVERLHEALAALEHHDAVVGPTDDGGFYLLGVKHCSKGLLANIPWSTSVTRERTVARLRDQGASVALLTPWFDVDVLADLERLWAMIQQGRVHAPATARVLRTFPSDLCDEQLG